MGRHRTRHHHVTSDRNHSQNVHLLPTREGRSHTYPVGRTDRARVWVVAPHEQYIVGPRASVARAPGPGTLLPLDPCATGASPGTRGRGTARLRTGAFALLSRVPPRP